MAASRDFVIESLRGGQNDTDAPSALPNDQCVIAENVEFFHSQLGERRLGCEAFTGASAHFADEAVIVHLSSWFPTNDARVPQLWGIGVTVGTSSQVSKFTTAAGWSEVTPSDALNTSEPDVYSISTQALNGKLFFAYRSAQNRLHVWDGTTLRRTGLAQPAAAPTAVNTGSGSYATLRYFRVRYIEKVGSAIKRRSEPSATLEFTPSGTGSGAVITRPALLSEGETHWELEASTDGTLFYIEATTAVGTSTYTDTTAFADGYDDGELSEAIGAYLTQPSAKFLGVDGDRLLMASHWTDTDLQCTVSWSRVSNDPGVGNDERLPIVTTGGDNIESSLTLDNFDGGKITGLGQVSNGSWYVFKWSHIYKMARTSDPTTSYEPIPVSKTRGAVPGSIVSGFTEDGQACIYFLDPVFGPSRLSNVGLQTIRGLRTTWRRVNTQADKIIAKSVYYPDKQQVHWWVAAEGNESPNLKLVLQTTELRSQGEGAARGWSIANGKISEAYTVTNFNEEVTGDPPILISLRSRPIIGVTSANGFILRCDTGTTDAGTAFVARIRTKPYFLAGILNKWGVMTGALLASANESLSLTVKLIRDYGKDSTEIETDLSPDNSDQSTVVKVFDDLSIAEAKAVQIEFTDA